MFNKVKCKIHINTEILHFCRSCYKKNWYHLNKNKEIICRNCNSKTKSCNGNLCKDCQSKIVSSNYTKNKSRFIKQAIEWKKNNPEKNKSIKEKYRKNNKQKIALANANYNNKNVNYRKDYFKKRRQNDLLFKLKQNISKSIRQALKKIKNKKDKRSTDILGCSLDFARIYLENQFKLGMTWENHGEWHIDHIIPLASAKSKEDIYKLCHYTNLQPLWAKENMDKKDKMPDGSLGRKLRK